jgi:Protein of unknown function (DUF3499)
MTRHCSRPGCNELAVAAFNFDGLRRIVWLNPIGTPRDHSAGDLCGAHADRLRPPVHWELRDLRSIDLTQAVRTKTTTGKQPAPATPLLSRAFRAAG